MKEKKITTEILSTIIYIIIVLLITFLIVTFVVQRTTVEGQSMEITLNNGDNLMLDKLTYRFKNPNRFEIIVFPHMMENEKMFYIKRVIGLPGETIRIDWEGNIYINGQILKEDYGKEIILDPGIAEKEIELGENEYFVLGDNRNHSSDSRDPSVGIIERDEIMGRVWIRIYPLNKIGAVR